MQQTPNDRKNHNCRCCHIRQEVEEEITDSEVTFNRKGGGEGGREREKGRKGRRVKREEAREGKKREEEGGKKGGGRGRKLNEGKKG